MIETVKQQLDVERSRMHGHRAGVELRDIEQRVQQFGQRYTRCLYLSDQALVLVRAARLLKLRNEKAQRMHRLAQIVAGDGEESRFRRIRSRQLVRAFLDLLFQASIRLAQLVRHLIELVSERLQLVAGGDLDSLFQPAFADACRALLQDLDRRAHLAGQQERRGYRKRDAEDEQYDGAKRRVVERLERLGERLLDEHVPAKGRNRSLSGQAGAPSPSAIVIVKLPSELPAAASAACTCESCERSVFFSTSPISGCEIRRPSESTT